MTAADLDSDESCPVADSLCSREPTLPLEQMVQLLLLDIRYPPPTALRILDPREMPPALERVAMQAQRCLQTWFAWTDGARTWFVVSELATVAIHRQRSAVRMFFYDDEGRFVSWGTWVLHSGGWKLCER